MDTPLPQTRDGRGGEPRKIQRIRNSKIQASPVGDKIPPIFDLWRVGGGRFGKGPLRRRSDRGGGRIRNTLKSISATLNRFWKP